MLERKVLRRCELLLFQCLSALLSVSIVTLENPATCPACLGFHLLRGPCPPLLFTEIFNSIYSLAPPALSPGFTVSLLSCAYSKSAQVRINPSQLSPPPFMPLSWYSPQLLCMQVIPLCVNYVVTPITSCPLSVVGLWCLTALTDLRPGCSPF